MNSIMTSMLLSSSGGLGVGSIIGIAIAALIIGLAVGILSYALYTKKKIGLAKNEAKKIIEEAGLEAKTLRQEEILKGTEVVNKQRERFEEEIAERKSDLQKRENRLLQKEELISQKEETIAKKEETIDKKEENLESKLDLLSRRTFELDKRQQENDDTKERLKTIEENLSNAQFKINAELERVAQMSKQEAEETLKAQLLEVVKKAAVEDAKKIEKEAKDNAEKSAQEIIAEAINRCASDYTVENTTTVVDIGSDEIKGKLIGRQGRNIHALESVMGVDVIIDDTHGSITLSSFDPVRREVARLTIEKLIKDGRIHPARIEEVAERINKDMQNTIRKAGEEAAFEANVNNMNPKLIEMLGRLKYRTSYGQNVLQHSIEVAKVASIIASELGINSALARRGGLLHDIGKAIDHEFEGTHVQLGVEYAKRYGESKDVIHIIESHHNDVEPSTLEAVIVQAADSISSARPGARRETLEAYIRRIEKIENTAKEFEGVQQCFALQAGREIRVMVNPETMDDTKTVFLSKEIAKKLEDELDYPGQIKVNVIREFRSVEYAK